MPCKWADQHEWSISTNPLACTTTVTTTPTRFEFKFFSASSARPGQGSSAPSDVDWEPAENHAVIVPRGVDVNSDDIVVDVRWGEGGEIQTQSNDQHPRIPTVPVPASNFKTLRIVFTVRYQCAHDERMYIVGSIPQLGAWNKMHSPLMSRLDNGGLHVFEIDVPVKADDIELQQANSSNTATSNGTGQYASSTNTASVHRGGTGTERNSNGQSDSATATPFDFKYKYLTRRGNDQTRKWEDGPNRVAKPLQMRSVLGGVFDEVEDDVDTTQVLSLVHKDLAKQSHVPKGNKLVHFQDQWEKICMEFSIYYPGKNPEDEVMHITGDVPEIGAWFKPGPTRMTLGPEQLLETDVRGRKWVKRIWVDIEQKPLSYRYILINTRTKQEVWEREPNRYTDFKTSAQHLDNIKNTNGNTFNDYQPTSTPPAPTGLTNSMYVFKDVNFVSEMKFDAVPPHMFIGPYPQSVEDVDTLARAGVTAVFNVQTDEDFKHRAIQWKTLTDRYDKHGIVAVRFPIRDFDRDSLKEHLHGAARQLDALLKKGRDVYVHCTAGMGRAPAVVVAYLCWVKGMALDEAVKHVKKYRTVAVPNVPVLEVALKESY